MDEKRKRRSFEKTTYIIKKKIYEVLPPISQFEIETTDFVPNFLNNLPNPIYNVENVDIDERIIEWKINYLFVHFKHEIISYYKQMRKNKECNVDIESGDVKDSLTILAELLSKQIIDF